MYIFLCKNKNYAQKCEYGKPRLFLAYFNPYESYSKKKFNNDFARKIF